MKGTERVVGQGVQTLLLASSTPHTFLPYAFQIHCFRIIISPPSLHFCFLPLLLPVSPLPPATAQAALWYSPSMLISGSDYTNGFRYGGSVGGREGNPTAPRLGFSKE